MKKVEESLEMDEMKQVILKLLDRSHLTLELLCSDRCFINKLKMCTVILT